PRRRRVASAPALAVARTGQARRIRQSAGTTGSEGAAGERHGRMARVVRWLLRWRRLGVDVVASHARRISVGRDWGWPVQQHRTTRGAYALRGRTRWTRVRSLQTDRRDDGRLQTESVSATRRRGNGDEDSPARECCE